MEQNLAQKERAILNAIASGKVSAVWLDPSRKGATITALKRGKPVSSTVIDRLYNRLVELQGEGQECHQRNSEEQELSRLGDRIRELEQENKSLREQNVQITAQVVQSLEQRLCAIEQSLKQIEQKTSPWKQMAKKDDEPERVLGFSMVRKDTKTAGKVYRKWYARRGKNVVYIGDNLSQAREKILAYCSKRGMSLNEAT